MKKNEGRNTFWHFYSNEWHDFCVRVTGRESWSDGLSCCLLFSPFFLGVCLSSCDGADRLTAYIAIGGNKEKIDDFCGAGTPRELMSNSAQMSLHFHSGAVSRGARGFKARYQFVSRKFACSPACYYVHYYYYAAAVNNSASCCELFIL